MNLQSKKQFPTTELTVAIDALMLFLKDLMTLVLIVKRLGIYL